MHGNEKAIAVRHLAQERAIDLSHSFAYSDSSNDIPLLSTVGNPIAINPDSNLKSYAVEHEWPVHDFRRQHLVKRYGLPAGAFGVALAGAAAGLAIAALVKDRRDQ